LSEELKRLISNPNLSSDEKRKLAIEIAAIQSLEVEVEKEFDRSYKASVLQLLQSIDDKLDLLLQSKEQHK